jgi:large subunit ribosomal protein L24
MKRDTERKKLALAKKEKKKALLNVHISKDLKKRMKKKMRSLLVRKGDRVRVMRGDMDGKEGKVLRVNYGRAVVFVEGITSKNSKGTEIPMALQPSNLLLLDVNMSDERKTLFEEKKEEKKAEATSEAKADASKV